MRQWSRGDFGPSWIWMQHNDTIRILIGCASQARLEACLALCRDTVHTGRAHRVASLRDLEDALRDRQWDLLIADEDHPELTPADALGALTAAGSDMACLVRAAEPLSAAALEWRRAGAREVLPAEPGELLPLAVAREVEALRVRRELAELRIQHAEVARRCELLLGTAREAIAYVVDGMHVHANSRYAALFGYTTVDDLASVPLVDLIDDAGQQEFKDALKRYRVAPEAETAIDFSGRRADDSRFDGELVLSTASFEGEPCMQVLVRERAGVSMGSTQASAAGPKALADVLRPAVGGQLVLLAVDGFAQHCRKLGVIGANLLVDELGAFVTRTTGWKVAPLRAADAVLAWHLGVDDPDAVAAEAREAIAALAGHIHEIGTQSVTCTVCAQVCPVDPECDRSVEEMLDRCWSALADTAERSAALRATDPARVDIAHLATPVATTSASTIAGPALEEALRGGDLRLLFQPIVSLRGDSSEYYEVFVRHRPSGKAAHAWLTENYPAADSAELDRLIARETLHKLAAHRGSYPQTRLVLPLGAGSVLDPGCTHWLAGALQEADVPPDCLAVAIDHRVASANLKQASELAGRLAALGCRLCITEVHSGANPLPDLVHLRPQLVRIADALSRVLGDADSTNTLLKPLIESLHREQIASVMPNVDSASTLAVLWQLGINFIEGDYLQPAQPQMSYEFSDLN